MRIHDDYFYENIDEQTLLAEYARIDEKFDAENHEASLLRLKGKDIYY